MSQPLRLGIIHYLNTLPIYYGVLTQQVSLSCETIQGVPTYLNKLLSEGRVDISVISSFEYACHPEKYYLFPNLSVSAKGPVHSIYLFSHQPIDQLEGHVQLPSTSFTSIHLLKYLLRSQDVQYVTKEQNEKVVAELLIGDEAIQQYHQNTHPYTYDLAELWFEQTQKPFVFAVWAVRRDVLDGRPDEVHEVFQGLLKSKQIFGTQYEQMAKEFNNGIFPSERACVNYLSNLKYDFSEEYQEGFLLFQKYCQSLNLLSQVAPLEFMLP